MWEFATVVNCLFTEFRKLKLVSRVSIAGDVRKAEEPWLADHVVNHHGVDLWAQYTIGIPISRVYFPAHAKSQTFYRLGSFASRIVCNTDSHRTFITAHHGV